MMNERSEHGVRMDKYLSDIYEDLTRTRAAKLIESGNCTVNGVVVSSKKYIVTQGDEIAVNIPEPEPIDVLPEDIPLDIPYEDDDVIVVNKSRGMVVHPAPGHCTGTLVNALMWYCNCQLPRAGIVHRIDKDTSGLIAIAKNDRAHLSLSGQLKKRAVLREYEAVVHGQVKQPGTVDAPIGRSVSDRKKMCVTSKNSREAVTFYEIIENYNQFTHLQLKLHTGRTHQIRVHMAYIGHPVAGDSVYGRGKGGQILHARKLGFVHPKTEKYIEVVSELPDYFTQFLKQL
jgi:23S rRNA pseudouridine1911/1915/1917 synthase